MRIAGYRLCGEPKEEHTLMVYSSFGRHARVRSGCMNRLSGQSLFFCFGLCALSGAAYPLWTISESAHRNFLMIVHFGLRILQRGQKGKRELVLPFGHGPLRFGHRPQCGLDHIQLGGTGRLTQQHDGNFRPCIIQFFCRSGAGLSCPLPRGSVSEPDDMVSLRAAETTA